jgi:biopolymer transport protein ExbD
VGAVDAVTHAAVVSITPDDKIFFGRDPVSKDDLAKKIGNVLKDKLPAEQVVYVKSDRLVKYGTVVGVIDTIREAGYERIGLVAEKEKESGGAPPQ